jgi:large subunit ribosomal protein L19
MLPWASTLSRRVASVASRSTSALVRPFSSSSPHTVDVDDMPYVHHGDRPRYGNYQKFKSPRKRASKLFQDLNDEAVLRSKEKNPAMWQEKFRVGDAIELKMVVQGGVHPKEGDSDKVQELEKIRGVVLGIVNRGLGSSVILRDVVFGEPIERTIPFHSPMVKEVTVLERNFIFKGKKKVKRAKLYYFRDRNPLCESIFELSCASALAILLLSL